MRRLGLLGLLLFSVLAGCIDRNAERQRALDEATTRCQSQGKQLHVVNLRQDGSEFSSDFHTTIDFQCVGPGEPGYVAPPPKPPGS